MNNRVGIKKSVLLFLDILGDKFLFLLRVNHVQDK